jgi:hypothetical protein
MPAITIPLDETHGDRHEWCRAMLMTLGVVGGGCDVAVIDTGVDPDWLAAQDLPHPPTITTHDLTRRQEGWREPSGRPHGSRIIADILRSAPLARIHSVRVHGDAQDADRTDIARAIEWCGRHRMQVANLSTAFYGDGCTHDEPCVLCRTINSVALSSGVFTAIASGDAYTLGEQIDRGEAPLQCPAARAQLGWSVASSEVVTPGAVLAERPEGGLSFTTGKFTSGVAQIRGDVRSLDLFEVRRAIRRTCVPSVHVPPAIGGFGRHCFLMAWLAASGMAAIAAGRPAVFDASVLRTPSETTPRGVDRELLAALQTLCAGPIMSRNWNQGHAVADAILGMVASWASPLDLALVRHVRASCREALGDDKGAAEDYEAGLSLLDASLDATLPAARGAAQ